jgi:hypothetical protein
MVTQASLELASAPSDIALVVAYLHARNNVTRLGYQDELEWQASRSVAGITESCFLSQAAWVILSSGMRETVVRKCFPRISEAFLHWKDADSIARQKHECVLNAKKSFNHGPKINAIAAAAEIVARTGFDEVHRMLQKAGPSYLQTFPYIGCITSLHLAKNLGIEVAKPDRHLVRIAAAIGWEEPGEMCQRIACMSGDAVSVVDIVLWRYATIEPNYASVLSSISEDHISRYFTQPLQVPQGTLLR